MPLNSSMERKLKLFGHIYSLDDNRLMKNGVLGIIDGLIRRGRPSREWVDDIKECQTSYHGDIDTNGRKPME